MTKRYEDAIGETIELSSADVTLADEIIIMEFLSLTLRSVNGKEAYLSEVWGSYVHYSMTKKHMEGKSRQFVDSTCFLKFVTNLRVTIESIDGDYILLNTYFVDS